MTIWTALLQGLIQGLTEFLPISSSGHLVLFQHFTGNSNAGSLFFSLMLHLGTLAAVIAAYYEDLWAMLKEVGRSVKAVFKGEFRWKAETPERKMLYMLFFATLPLIAVIPLRGLVGNLSADGDIIVEGVCFLFTSLLLFGACKAKPGKAGLRRMKAPHALAVGVMQGIAVLPGISRSGSTLATGMILGFDRAFIVKFSFLLSIPAILGGAVAEIGDVAKTGIDVDLWPLFIGMLTAAVVGYVCIRLIRWLVLSDKLVIFAWYTLVLGGIVVIVGIIQHIAGAGGAPQPAISAVSDAVSSMPPSSVVPSSAAVLLRQFFA